MNKPSPDLIKDVHLHQQLNESRLSNRELFYRLEKDRHGRIEVHRLIELLEKVGLETSTQKRSDTARVSGGRISIGEESFVFVV